MGTKAVVLFDSAGYRNEDGDPAFASYGEVVELDDKQFTRLADLGAVRKATKDDQERWDASVENRQELVRPYVNPEQPAPVAAAEPLAATVVEGQVDPDALSKDELVAIAQQYDLSIEGTKADIAERINLHRASAPPSATP